MAVDSYLELFTTLFGWQWYGIIWDVLADTGIVLIPFVIMVIRTWRDAARGGAYGSTHELALRGLELEFYVAIFVAIIAGPPTVTLNASMLSYQAPPDITEPSPPVATPTSSQSTYGNPGAFSGAPSAVQLPIWWYTVLALSKGVNHAIMAGIPNSGNIRLVREQAKLSSITDPALRAEVSQFYSDCFVPARSAYLREKPTGSTVTSILDDYGEDDPDWMGSHLLRTLYYPKMRAMRPVSGWAYDATRDADFDPSLPHPWGRPYCSEWWSDPSNGLRERIVALPEASKFRNTLAASVSWLSSYFPSMTNAAEKTKDKAVRVTLENSLVDAFGEYQPDNLGAYGNDQDSALYTAVQKGVAAAGAATEHLTTGAMLTALKPMLLIAQAILLMVVYALLPLIVVLSGYSLNMLVLGAIGIFTINFWSVLWKLAQWIDDNLMVSMFDGVGAIDRFIAGVSNDGLFGSITKTYLIDLLLAALMLGMPLIWTMMMGWVGVQVGRGMTKALDNSTSSAEATGKAGVGVGKSGLAKAAKRWDKNN